VSDDVYPHVTILTADEAARACIKFATERMGLPDGGYETQINWDYSVASGELELLRVTVKARPDARKELSR